MSTTRPQTEQPVESPSRYALITRVLALRSQPRMAGVMAGIRAAVVPATEAMAFPYTEAHLGSVRGTEVKRAVRRAAAICAIHKEAAQPKQGVYLPLGFSLRRLHEHKRNFGYSPGEIDSQNAPRRNAMTMQVDALPLMPFEQAAETLNLLIGRCADLGIAVDFYNLARTLAAWGDGISANSRTTRNRIVQDFYSSDAT